MARRYGKPVDLWDEVMFYLRGMPSGILISRWRLRDFLDGCRGNEFSEKEFEEIVARLQNTYGIILSEGSMSESMQSVSPEDLLRQEKLKMDRRGTGFVYMSKLDELALSHMNKPPKDS